MIYLILVSSMVIAQTMDKKPPVPPRPPLPPNAFPATTPEKKNSQPVYAYQNGIVYVFGIVTEAKTATVIKYLVSRNEKIVMRDIGKTPQASNELHDLFREKKVSARSHYFPVLYYNGKILPANPERHFSPDNKTILKAYEDEISSLLQSSYGILEKNTLYLYGTERCGRTISTRNGLEEKGIQYVFFDVSKDRKKKSEMFGKLKTIGVVGRASYPVVVFNDHVMMPANGFNRDQFIQEIEKIIQDKK